MKNKLHRKQLSVKKSNIHGYGVFAEETIRAGDIVEECHVLLTDKGGEFADYYFNAGDKSALALGFGSLYNHSPDPQLSYYFYDEDQVIVFYARRFIAKGEEIFVSYGDTWFSCRDVMVKEIPFLRKAWRYFKGMPLRALLVIGAVYGVVFLIPRLL